MRCNQDKYRHVRDVAHCGHLMHLQLRVDALLLGKIRVVTFATNTGYSIQDTSGQSRFTEQNDTLVDKLFGDVKATSENKNVKRSINITVEDSIVDDKK